MGSLGHYGESGTLLGVWDIITFHTTDLTQVTDKLNHIMLLQVTDKLNHIMLYQVHLAWEGVELTTLVVIDTYCPCQILGVFVMSGHFPISSTINCRNWTILHKPINYIYTLSVSSQLTREWDNIKYGPCTVPCDGV
jgi:hypothetical protein